MNANQNARIIRVFLEEVRSGKHPERAERFFAPRVLAHQVTAADPTTVERTPQGYAKHVAEMVETFGDFEFRIDELIADGDKVYARWTQHGHHVGPIDEYAPTGLPLTEVASCVYRVEDGLIHEYWIQIDNAGMQAQLEANAVR